MDIIYRISAINPGRINNNDQNLQKERTLLKSYKAHKGLESNNFCSKNKINKKEDLEKFFLNARLGKLASVLSMCRRNSCPNPRLACAPSITPGISAIVIRIPSRYSIMPTVGCRVVKG